MGLAQEARHFALAGTGAVLVYLIALWVIPGEVPGWVNAGVNTVSAYFLYRWARSDMDEYEAAPGPVSKASWVQGALIGLGGLVLFYAAYLIIGMMTYVAFSILGIPFE
jgi:hypothetical protein